ncbi:MULTISPECIES: hypothetical protein [Vibrio]|uniref:Uncharacterized protein n=1 Tax=Vibrio tasmaniensis TaxID=212663 RepID=A0A2N7NJA7_9VIBR|nr:hypothetical protein [Vibrio tasmaniensis]PMP15037.1 hypothetical protein BCS92_13570 [Vibrio tasmaniensis]TKG34619.1 hypothetical protein FC057_08925 [Vibrio tasmaniensis]TKG42874.1 hypothetical protein FC063_04750 [Vibrio tasmaniensis]TKG52215.1 hypothetical protein FC061_10215 [Vibrio tasmaniensis]TKG53511.1 hypothetical protein FC060_00825 [Vibrio tasmaniensis]
MRSLDLTQLHEIRRQKIISQFTNQTENSAQPIDEQTLNADQNPKVNSEGFFSNESSTEIKQVQNETTAEELKSKLNKVKNRNSHVELQIANEKRKAAEANNRAAQANAKAIAAESKAQQDSNNNNWNSRVDKALRWLKVAFLAILLLAIFIAASLGLYYLFRLVTEEPIIKTVTETVTETVEKEVIPEECTQVRRNGKVYVSCDGVTVKGAPTIAESGVDEIPDLIEQ